MTPDLGKPTASEDGAEHALAFELRDPGSLVLADGAPPRFNIRRLIEYTQFDSWSDVSNALWPWFDKAATLGPKSAVREEAAKIASSTSDPVARAQAALNLVEDQVRYVYIGLNGGNYEPATADETWSRRFGDCKAKTVLLLALLHELGIPAEAVLVNTSGGDGTNERLPDPSFFDHVLVRATIGTKAYWLDGTREGDRHIELLPAPLFRWALPIRAGHAELEAVQPTPLTTPLVSSVLDIDASAGFAAPAKVRAEMALRGDDVRKVVDQIGGLSAEDQRRAVEAYWRNTIDWVDPSKVGWRYDDFTQAVIFTMVGEGKLKWEGDDQNGRSLEVFDAGFTPPNELRRPKEQDQMAPWATEFPSFKRWTTIIRLPRPTGKWRWDYSAAPVHELLGGVAYWREAELKDGVLRMTMSRRTYLPEITAAQAQEIADRLPTFDNNISQVFETDRRPDDHAARSSGAKPPTSVRDWSDADAEVRHWLAQAKIDLDQSKPDAALPLLDRAIDAEPQDASAHIDRAQALDRLGRRGEAFEDIEEAWRINPLDPAVSAARAKEMALVKPPDEGGIAYDPWADPSEKTASLH